MVHQLPGSLGPFGWAHYSPEGQNHFQDAIWLFITFILSWVYSGVSQSLCDGWYYKKLNAEAVIRTRWRLIHQTLQRFANMQNNATLSLIFFPPLNFCLENSSLIKMIMSTCNRFNTIIFRWNKYFKIFSINFWCSKQGYKKAL